MCGIIAVVNNSLPVLDIRNYVKQGLQVDSLRGEDSTGVFVIDDKGDGTWFKKPIPGWDFVQMVPAMRVVDTHMPRFVVGHNRAATRGSATNPQHIHPVIHEDIMLVHNGTLNSTYSLNGENFGHDSSAIAESFHTKGELETLELLQGSYALIWYNFRTSKLNFARNDERPLYLGYEKDNRGWYIASEENMLWMLADRNRIALKSVNLLKEGVVISIPLDKKEATIRTKFKIYKPISTNLTYNRTPAYYETASKGQEFPAIYEGSYIDNYNYNRGGTVLKFKRPNDSMYSWLCNLTYQQETAPGRKQLEVGKTYMIKATQPRLVTTDAQNKEAEVVSQEPVAAITSVPITDTLYHYKKGDKIKFYIVSADPMTKHVGFCNLLGVSTDTNDMEVKSFGVPDNLIRKNIEYEGVVNNIVLPKSTHHEYVVVDSATVQPVDLSGEDCEWCHVALTTAEGNGNNVPEIGGTCKLCDNCLTYHEMCPTGVCQ